jgi:RNase adaptor protein for sRNA GlmZ degradation
MNANKISYLTYIGNVMNKLDKHEILLKKIKKLDAKKELLIKRYRETGDASSMLEKISYILTNKLRILLKK